MENVITRNKEGIEAIYPLSPMQEGMLFHSISDPDSIAYFEQFTYTYRGKLNTGNYKRAWQRVVDQHPILRTLVLWERKGKPLQLVRRQVTLAWQEEDWSASAPEEQCHQLDRFLEHDRQRSFNLKRAPLMRLALIRMSENEYRFIWSFHHMLLDGWSGSLLLSDVFRHYCAFNQGGEVESKNVRPYKDYITWLQAQDIVKAEAFWRKTLSGFTAPTSLHSAMGLKQNESLEKYETECAYLSEDTTSAIKSLAREHQLTLNTVIQGAWGLLLSRYTGEKDVVFGATVSGRPTALENVEEMLGLFINTLPVRVQIDANAHFVDWLKECQLQQLETRQFDFSPLVDVQKWSDVAPGQPLFTSIIVFENFPVDDSIQRNLGFQITATHTREQTNFPLTLGVEPSDPTRFKVLYDCRYYDSATITRLLGHLKAILESVANEPTQKLSSISMLTDPEREQLLNEWNQTQVEYPIVTGVHHLFEERVEQHPEAIALISNDQHLTYAELNQQSNQLAHYLMSLGVRPDSLVGVCLEGSLEMSIALLAILKAGGAYVPFDPDFPKGRLEFMLEDTQAEVILTQDYLRERIPSGQVKILCLDDDRGNWAHQATTNPTLRLDADNLFNVIFTSGSTGRPKGVMVPHRGIINLLLSLKDAYLVGSNDRFLQKTPYSFDAAVYELFLPLISGARLIYAKPEGHKDPEYIRDIIVEQGITTVLFTPSMLNLFLQTPGLEQCVDLRRVFCGGEALQTEQVRLFFERLSHTELHNQYGPTEASVLVTRFACQSNESYGCIPIGKPTPNTQLYILDTNLNPVPQGVTGELYIGGVQLARGYLNRKELTQSTFIENPYHKEGHPSKRLYRTGDRARYLPDGNIEFMGRMDFQVKLHGLRIELGEIESHLIQIEGVVSSLVIVREDRPGDRKLVAYLVPDKDTAIPTHAELRQLLQEHLPRHMIPSSFVRLGEFPLTPNEKIDRKALPTPESDHSVLESDFVPPSNLVEERLADIWCEVLRLQRVGIHDNFFELGGDSIISIQIIVHARKQAIHITTKQIFQYPTISELAAISDETKALKSDQSTVTGRVPLTPIQQWFLDQDLPSKHHWNQAYLLKLPAEVNVDLLKQSLRKLLAHHDALRLRFYQEENLWHQENMGKAELAFEQIDVSEIAPTQLNETLESMASRVQASLDLEKGRLLQSALFDPGPDKPKLLLLAIHHLAVDAVSWRILLRDLETVYLQLASGKIPLLPEKTLSFKEWAEKLRTYAQSQSLENDIKFWQGTLQAAQPIPVDQKNYDDNTQGSEQTISVFLDYEKTQALLRDVPSIYRTRINDVLLTALVYAYQRWTGKSSLTFDLEGHGREELDETVDLSRTVGWFTTMYPVTLELDVSLHPGQLLMSVKEQLRTIPNRGLGWGVLRYLGCKHQKEALQRENEPEILFNYLGQFDQTFSEDSFIQIADESPGFSCDLEGKRSHLLEINAWIIDDQLRIDWAYSSAIHHRQTIESFSAEFVRCLETLIEHCLSPGAGGCTPSDFPLAKLSGDELSRLVSTATRRNEHSKAIADIYPLSPMQEGMLYHSLVEEESSFYFNQFRCLLRGNLNVQAFQRAWQKVLDQHTILRTAFFWDGSHKNMQVVFRHSTLPFVCQDWRDTPRAERSKRIDAFLEEDKVNTFQLDRSPLLRVALLRLTDTEYQFVWSFHHILLDGWSSSLLLDQVFTCYEHLINNNEEALSKSRDYANYIAWLKQQDISRTERHWRRLMSGYSAPLSLTALENAPPHSENVRRFEERQFRLSQQTSAALETLIRRHQITMNTLFQGIWGLLLHRYCGEKDVVFGTVVSGRPAQLTGVEEMIGLLINTLPVRINIDSSAPVLDLFKNIQEQQLEMREYQHSALTDIHGWSDVPRTEPLFETLLIFENPSISDDLSKGKKLQICDIAVSERTNFPLTLFIDPGSEIVIDAAYDATRFNADRITRIGEHIQIMVRQIIDNPKLVVRDLSLLTDHEHRLFSSWNATQSEFPAESCVHQLVSAQAEKTPDKIAISCNGDEVSYRELERRSNQLAHHLGSLNVRPDELVGLLVERSITMVVGMLGILKAGAAYLPLDPEYPKDRLAFIISDAQIALLLTESEVEGELPDHSCDVIRLDSERETIEKNKGDLVETAVRADHLAYVIYTSGSTGKPKGVEISHRAVCNFLTSMSHKPGMSGEDTILAVTTLSFDIAVLELLLPLTVGARIELADGNAAADGNQLLRSIENNHVTIMQATPTTWRLLIAAGWEGSSDFKILCGGEAMPRDLAPELVKRAGSVWNMYGPTETTVWSTLFQVTDPSKPLLIGTPIENTQVYILDACLNQQPVGVAGELYIGGAGLARGYLRREELTQSAFVENPFYGQEQLSTRLYKTGDLARYLPDGNIEYLGRGDFQVKVRGYRVELGEIEAWLIAFPDVGQATAVVREDRPGDQRLVAYYVAEAGKVVKATISELRDHLRKYLPNYMIPQYIVALESMPLTPNGKIDKKALPVPYKVTSQVKRRASQLATPHEKLLAHIWQELLGVERVTGEDNFFELGGHSLLSLQFIMRVKEETGVDIPPRETALNTLSQFGAMLDRAAPKPQAAIESTTATTQEDDKQSKKETTIGTRLKRLFKK